MRAKKHAAIAAAALSLLVLSGCTAAGQTAPTAEASTPATSESDGTGTDASVGLETSESDLGVIVVDTDGRTVYQYDADTQGGGESACAGQCATLWPAVPGSDAPQLDGITGEVATITGVDGAPQLTLDGWPLYYYAGDETPGATTGQAVGDVWWVLTPAGEPIRG